MAETGLTITPDSNAAFEDGTGSGSGNSDGLYTTAALVTGASGFIGRALCLRLQQEGTRVWTLMRTPCAGPWNETITCDLECDEIPVAACREIDTVFHLAGKVHALAQRGEADDYRRVNVEGTRKLLHAAQAAGVKRFVFISSVKAMGEGGGRCLDEEAEIPPETPYGQSKREAEKLVLAAASEYQLHATVLRLSMVYGPGCKGNLPRMLRAVSRGRFPPLPDTGNRRSMVHVQDVVQAALLVAEKRAAAGNVYLVTDGHDYSTAEIYRLVCQALGKQTPTWHIPQTLLRAIALMGDLGGTLSGRRMPLDSDSLQKLMGSAWYSSERLRTLGYRSAYDLAAGLKEMVVEMGLKPEDSS